MKRILAAFLLAAAVCFASAGCSSKGSSASEQKEQSGGVTITFMGSQVDYGGKKLDGNTVNITSGGTYILCGTLEDGQVIVDAGDENVVLVLQDAEINCSSGSAIDIRSAGRAVITAHDSTQNTVTASWDLSGTDDFSAVNAECDLTLSGGGSLSVRSESGSAIYSHGRLTAESGTYNITTAGTALMGGGGVDINDGKFVISAQSDAIGAGTALSCADMTISGGTFKIESGSCAVQVSGDLTISGGEFEITSAGDSGQNQYEADKSAETEKESGTAMGLNAGGFVTVSGGTFKIDAQDDGVHGGTVTINAGGFEISAGKYGIHAGGNLTINSGEISAETLGGGFAGSSVEINEGSVDIISGDDGISASGGDDPTGAQITINGGIITVNAGRNGLDSNGSIYINGGYAEIYGAENTAGRAIECTSENGGVLSINGGTLAAFGTSDAAKASENSQQCSVLWYPDTEIEAGSIITAADSQGAAVLEYTVQKSCTEVMLSCPEFAGGEIYVIKAGEQYAGFEFTSNSAEVGRTGAGTG